MLRLSDSADCHVDRRDPVCYLGRHTCRLSIASFLVLVVGGVGCALLFGARQPVLGVVVIAITILGVIVVSFISSALSQIFRVAGYRDAITGDAPDGFDRQAPAAAFAQR